MKIALVALFSFAIGALAVSAIRPKHSYRLALGFREDGEIRMVEIVEDGRKGSSVIEQVFYSPTGRMVSIGPGAPDPPQKSLLGLAHYRANSAKRESSFISLESVESDKTYFLEPDRLVETPRIPFKMK